MSEDNHRIFEIYRELERATDVPLMIRTEQVHELTVACLMSKYAGAKRRNAENSMELLKKVLLGWFLSAQEFKELEENLKL